MSNRNEGFKVPARGWTLELVDVNLPFHPVLLAKKGVTNIFMETIWQNSCAFEQTSRIIIVKLSKLSN
jgi:hypothetical protein